MLCEQAIQYGNEANDFGYRLDGLESGFLNNHAKANDSLSFIDY